MKNLGYLEEKILKGKTLGIPDEKLEIWTNRQIEKLNNKGYKKEQILESLGKFNTQKIYNDEEVVEPINDYWDERTNVIKNKNSIKTWAVGEESQIYEYFKQGFGESSTNFMLQYHTNGEQGYDWKKAFNGNLKDDGAIERLARSIGTLAGDTVPGLIGYLPTFLLTKSPIASGAVSGFAVESVKKAYYESLKSNKVKNFSTWWKMFVDKGVSEGIKGGAMFAGTIAGGAGAVKIASGLPNFVGKQFLSTLAGTYVGMTSMGVAIESAEKGKLTLPSKQQLTDNLLLLTALMGGGASVKKVYDMSLNTMSKTGKSLKDVKKEIMQDGDLKAEYESSHTKVPSSLKKLYKKEIKIFKTELNELKKIAEGKETVSKETLQNNLIELQNKKETTKSQEDSILLSQQIKSINRKLEEFKHRENPSNRTVLSKGQQKIEKELQELGEYIELNKIKIDVRDKDSVTEDTRMDKYLNDNVEFGKIEKNKTKTNESFFEGAFNSFKRTAQDYIDYRTQTIFDDLSNVKIIEEAMVASGARKRFVYEMMTNLSGVMAKASSWLDGIGTYNLKTDKVDGQSLMDVLRPLEKLEGGAINYTWFTGYKIAKRVLEKHAQGIDLNINIKESEYIVNTYKNKYEKISKEFDKIQEKKIQAYVDSGLISKELALKIRELNKDYFPMQKLYDPKFKGEAKLGGVRLKQMKGLASLKNKIDKVENELKLTEETPSKGVLQDPAKNKKIEKLKKLQKELVEELQLKTKSQDPIEIEMRDMLRGLALAEKNMTLQAFFKMVEEVKKLNPDSQEFNFIKRVKPSIQEIKISRKELEKILPEDMIAKLSDEEVQGFSVFRADRQGLKPTEVGVSINGKRIIYDVGDEVLAMSLNRSKTYNGLFSKAAQESVIFKAAQGFSSIKRLGITSNPEFALITALTQEIMLPLITNVGYIPVIDLFRGVVWQMGIKNPKTFKDLTGITTKEGRERAKKISQEFEKNLGRSTFLDQDKNIVTSSTVRAEMEKRPLKHEILPDDSVSPYLYPFELLKNITIKGIPRVAKSGIQLAQIPIQVTERGARLVIREKKIAQLTKQNETLPQNQRYTEKEIETLSTFEARDIQDFGRFGANMEAYSRINVFLNAGLQGVYKIYRVAKTPEQRARALQLGFYGMTIPTILLWFANKDSDTYNNVVKPFEKKMYWVFVTNEEKKEYVVLRRPWEVGWIFARLPEIMLESAFKTDKDYINKLESHWLANAGKYFLNFVPTADFLTGYWEDATNRNSYTRKQLRPRKFGDDGLPAEFETTRSTSTIAKGIGHAIRAIGQPLGFGRDYGSPFMIDHYIKSLVGPAGITIIKGLDQLIYAAGGDAKKYIKPWNDNTVSNLSRIPMIDYFFKRKGLSAETLEKYWQNYKRIKPYVGLRKELLSRGEDESTIRRIQGEYQYKISKYFMKNQKAMQKAYEGINKANSREVGKSTFTPQEVAELIDMYIDKMMRIADRVNNKVFTQKELIKKLKK